MAGVAKLLVHMIDFCLKNLIAIDCSLWKGVGIHLFSVLRTQLSKKVKITSENHRKLFLLSLKLVKKL